MPCSARLADWGRKLAAIGFGVMSEALLIYLLISSSRLCMPRAPLLG